ncbi:Lsr2 family protein [Streptomyces griseofuscus]|uniref:histone-like nucleoid-structuring protein Lsr2 n=1 Tax=Streptomyces griseofuscus TaxID=146922 RepID=UPI0036741021
MAQKVEVLLIDDLDGSEAQETVTFGLDGRTYEIDLNEANEAEFRNFLERYTKAGRRVSGRSGQKQQAAPRAATGHISDTVKIRGWAKENGYEVNDRGRISGSLREAYYRANS